MPLNVGSIAIVGFNADGNDNLAFVALVDIPAGETIYFEDNEWNGTSFIDTNESALAGLQQLLSRQGRSYGLTILVVGRSQPVQAQSSLPLLDEAPIEV
jgi:hypothetical protein